MIFKHRFRLFLYRYLPVSVTRMAGKEEKSVSLTIQNRLWSLRTNGTISVKVSRFGVSFWISIRKGLNLNSSESKWFQCLLNKLTKWASGCLRWIMAKKSPRLPIAGKYFTNEEKYLLFRENVYHWGKNILEAKNQIHTHILF